MIDAGMSQLKQEDKKNLSFLPKLCGLNSNNNYPERH